MKDKIYEALEDLFKELTEREKDVVLLRYTINSPERKKISLEEIGDNFSLTRERIRQIQNNALLKITSRLEKNVFLNKDFLLYLNKIFGKFKLKPESYLKNKLVEDFDFNLKDYKVFVFFIKVHNKVFIYEEDKNFRSFIYLEKHYKENVKKFLIHINKLFKEKPFFKEEEFINKVKKEIKYHFDIDIPNEEVLEFSKIFKIVFKNPFGEIGSISHYRIAPNSLIEKIRTLLEIEEKPLHFQKIYDKLLEIKKIEDEFIHRKWKKNFSSRTIHSTLNNNDDFVLVGRGVYALKDWNLPEGKIFEVMKNIIKENPGIDINELKEKLSKVRYFTDKTFYIYTYKYFKKIGNKVYIN